jgi:hypothetical protein
VVHGPTQGDRGLVVEDTGVEEAELACDSVDVRLDQLDRRRCPGRGVATRLLGPSHHLRHCERVRDGAAGEHEVLLFQRAVEDAQVQTVRPNRAAS